jgi:hypothetical protein
MQATTIQVFTDRQHQEGQKNSKRNRHQKDPPKKQNTCHKNNAKEVLIYTLDQLTTVAGP